MKTPTNQKGFTIIEIIIAIIVLTVGVLGLVTTGALVTRMIARGQRSAVAAAFGSRRLERMRVGACIVAQRVNGQDTLYRGSQWVAINTWTFTDAGNQNYRLKVVTRYRTVKNRVRSDSTETTIPCNVFG
ncbi:MAG TPA: prepilin-type N-terminal cleavage/methylation domain-containing protein [Gemmatimonadales bacterium]|jgi:prepilin-type N-terminal cleavage/methylation domain-containing protein|nr:prepilin-type N-terminal cleavage/methylation domain-containing protein [Gemmatimonadales bacterium]